MIIEVNVEIPKEKHLLIEYSKIGPNSLNILAKSINMGSWMAVHVTHKIIFTIVLFNFNPN